MCIISGTVFVAIRLACAVYTHIFMDTRACTCIISRQAWDSWTDASQLVYTSAFASNEVNVNEAQTSPDTVVRPSLLFTLSCALAAIPRVQHTTREWIFFSSRPFVRSTRSTNYSVVNARDFTRKQPVPIHKEFREILETYFTVLHRLIHESIWTISIENFCARILYINFIYIVLWYTKVIIILVKFEIHGKMYIEVTKYLLQTNTYSNWISLNIKVY